MTDLTPEQWIAALSDRDVVGKALLLVSRAREKISFDLGFAAPKKWPNMEPAAVADDIWAGFAAQHHGENILEDWRREGRALVNTIATVYLARPPRPEVAQLIEERNRIEAEWRLGQFRTAKVKARAARLAAIDLELRALGISPI